MSTLFAFLLAWTTSAALAQPSDEPDALNARIEALEEQMQALRATRAPRASTDENTVRVVLPKPETSSAAPAYGNINPEFSWIGLGPVASRPYAQPQAPVSFGLSTEFFTFRQQKSNVSTSPNPNRSDVAVLAPALAVRVAPRVLFNSQIEFEHGGAESSDTVALRKGAATVRMAYLDWTAGQMSEWGVRVGHQLVPIGLVNTTVDPTTYFSVQRPELERELLPALWHENGAVLWFNRPHAQIELGAMNSLNASGFRQATFLAGGRSQGQNSAADDWMGVLRVSAFEGPFRVGLSAAFGNSAQGSASLRNGAFQVGEAHVEFRAPRLNVLAMIAQGDVQDADAISILNNTIMAERARGYSLQAAIETLGSSQKLWLFTRMSQYNLHDRVAQGYIPDPSLKKTIVTSGLSYLPFNNLVLKLDYENHSSAAGHGEDVFNLGCGLIY